MAELSLLDDGPYLSGLHRLHVESQQLPNERTLANLREGENLTSKVTPMGNVGRSLRDHPAARIVLSLPTYNHSQLFRQCSEELARWDPFFPVNPSSSYGGVHPGGTTHLHAHKCSLSRSASGSGCARME